MEQELIKTSMSIKIPELSDRLTTYTRWRIEWDSSGIFPVNPIQSLSCAPGLSGHTLPRVTWGKLLLSVERTQIKFPPFKITRKQVKKHVLQTLGLKWGLFFLQLTLWCCTQTLPLHTGDVTRYDDTDTSVPSWCQNSENVMVLVCLEYSDRAPESISCQLLNKSSSILIID